MQHTVDVEKDNSAARPTTSAAFSSRRRRLSLRVRVRPPGGGCLALDAECVPEEAYTVGVSGGGVLTRRGFTFLGR